MKKGITIIVILLVLLSFIRVDTGMWYLLLPFICLAGMVFVAKAASNRKGDNGPLSKAYKKRFVVNRIMYRCTCLFSLHIPLLLVSQNVYSVTLSDNFVRIFELIFTAGFSVSGLLWVVTELVRKDFPWGIPRFVERLAKLLIFDVLFYFSGLLLAGIFERYMEQLIILYYVLIIILVFAFLAKLLDLIRPSGTYVSSSSSISYESEDIEKRTGFYYTGNSEFNESSLVSNQGNYIVVKDQNGNYRNLRPHGSSGMMIDDEGNYYRSK